MNSFFLLLTKVAVAAFSYIMTIRWLSELARAKEHTPLLCHDAETQTENPAHDDTSATTSGATVAIPFAAASSTDSERPPTGKVKEAEDRLWARTKAVEERTKFARDARSRQHLMSDAQLKQANECYEEYTRRVEREAIVCIEAGRKRLMHRRANQALGTYEKYYDAIAPD